MQAVSSSLLKISICFLGNKPPSALPFVERTEAHASSAELVSVINFFLWKISISGVLKRRWVGLPRKIPNFYDSPGSRQHGKRNARGNLVLPFRNRKEPLKQLWDP